jgi:hypothetical protein
MKWFGGVRKMDAIEIGIIGGVLTVLIMVLLGRITRKGKDE